MKKSAKRVLRLSLVMMFLLVWCNSALAIERVSILPATTRAKAPISNVFQLQGRNEKFILLDNTAEGYFVMSEKILASRTLSVDGEPVAFDPENPNSIAHWLNNEFLEGTYLPKPIVENLVEREYLTEAGGSKVSFNKDYISKCKVVILSQTEWSKYNANFGYADDTSSAFWALRSVRSLTGSPIVAATSAPNAGLTFDGKWTSKVGLRPAFYLSKDFFEKVSINVEKSGDAIISLIRKETETDKLNKMYNSSDVFTLTSTDISPMADKVSIVGRGIVGEKITGSYSFVSLDGNAQDGTQIQWQKSKTKLWWSTIPGATETDYVPTQSDVGYYIKMKVTPMTETMSGASYESVPLAVTIRPISTPQATDVRIVTEEPVIPGTILDVKYSFSDENRDICSETDYVWEVSEDKQDVQSIGNSRYLKLTNNEVGKYVRVGVVPKKQTNSASGRKTVAGEISYSEWALVENLPMVTDVAVSRGSDLTVAISKTEDVITLTSDLTEAENQETEKVSATYTVEKSSDYSVVCEWQSAQTQFGEYTTVAVDSDTLEYTPGREVWLRAKVYTKNSEICGKAVYSEPVKVGSGKLTAQSGELSLTQQLSAGKKYEIWISNKNVSNNYAYSFQLDGNWSDSYSSDAYLVNILNQADTAFVIGTLIAGTDSNGYCFKAGEITAAKDGQLVISNVLTTAHGDGDVSPAKVFIVEK